MEMSKCIYEMRVKATFCFILDTFLYLNWQKKITFSQWKKITYMHKTANSIINIVGYKKLIVKHLK